MIVNDKESVCDKVQSRLKVRWSGLINWSHDRWARFFTTRVHCAVLREAAAIFYLVQLDLRAYGEKAVPEEVGRGGRTEVGCCTGLQGRISV